MDRIISAIEKAKNILWQIRKRLSDRQFLRVLDQGQNERIKIVMPTVRNY